MPNDPYEVDTGKGLCPDCGSKNVIGPIHSVTSCVFIGLGAVALIAGLALGYVGLPLLALAVFALYAADKGRAMKCRFCLNRWRRP